MTHAPATDGVPKNPAMRRAWISYQLRIRGLSGRAVADREGVSRQSVSAAMNGGGASSHLQEALAAAIDLEPHQLFPELYDARGHRLGIVRPPNRSTRHGEGNDKNEEAA